MRCLYLIYWGATEPIGLSGTLPTLERLARDHGEELVLVSYDKPQDRRDQALVAKVRRRLEAAGARWVDLGYTKDPRNWSTAWDIARGVVACAALVRRERIDVVHARTFVGGLVGTAVGRLTGVPVVLHLDGFWPHERVDDGVWAEGSRGHRVARFLEDAMYRRADATIFLSRIAEREVRARLGLSAPTRVVHTSVDPRRFPARVDDVRPADPLELVYLGSLGGRYMTDALFAFFAAALRADPRTRVTVLTRAPRATYAAALARAGLAPESLDVRGVASDDVPAELARRHAGVFFLAEGLSSAATSATKVGEYLAAGLPVLVTAGAGDLPDVLERTRTGVVLRAHDPAAHEAAFRALSSLAREPGIGARCRAVAEATMGVEVAARAQAELHARVVREGAAAPRG